MIATLANLFNDKQETIRGKVFAVYILLFVVNAAAWLWAIVAFRNYPVLLGTAALA
jgi:nickel/cobalt transporter (NiCoT) family protein